MQTFCHKKKKNSTSAEVPVLSTAILSEGEADLSQIQIAQLIPSSFGSYLEDGKQTIRTSLNAGLNAATEQLILVGKIEYRFSK